MKSFELIRKYMRVFGISKRNPNHKIVSILLNCIHFGLFTIYLLGNGWFLIFEAQTFAEYSECSFYLLCAALVLWWYLVYVVKRDEYSELMDDLDAIIGMRYKNPAIKTIYEKTVAKTEGITRKAHKIVIVVQSPLYISTFAISVIISYHLSGHSNDSFALIYQASFPFNWRAHPFAYFVSFSIEAIIVMFATALFVYTLTLTIGFCHFGVAFILDIEESLRCLNDELIFSLNQKFSVRKSNDIKRNFAEIIQFHADAKGFANRFSDTNSGIIFAYLLYMLVSFCSLLLQLNTFLAQGNYVGATLVLSNSSILLFWLHLFCESGHRLTQRFEDVANDAYTEITWYSMPLGMQKSLPLMISLGQKSVHLRGFVGTRCTREVFMKIMKSTFQYFLVLREFDF